jgi:hypothetical protein
MLGEQQIKLCGHGGLTINLVPTLTCLLQAIAVVMNSPTRKTFLQIVGGWVFSRKRTVTRMIEYSGAGKEKHFCCFHRFLSAATRSLDASGINVFQLLEPLLGKNPVFLIVDDTPARKRGRKIFGVGWHHDPLIKNLRAKTGWVVLGVAVRFRVSPHRTFCLPILFRLYLNHEQSAKQRRVHRTRSELAMEMLKKLCAPFGSARFTCWAMQPAVDHR